MIASTFLYIKLSEVNDIKKMLSSYNQISYQKEISLLKEKVTILTDANEMLKKRLHEKNISYNDINTTLSTKKQQVVIVNQLDNMQTSDIINTLKNYMSFDESLIPPGMNIRNFSKKLLDIAMNKEDELINDPNHVVSDVKFSSNLDSNDSTYNSNFDQNTSKIFAKFDTTNFVDGKLLVKWKKDNGELVNMNFYNVKKNSKDNFIWMQKKDGWSKGNYQIDIYSPSNRLKKIYSSSYLVN